MRKYEKPVLQVIELSVSEQIAVMVPKTIYTKGSGSTFSNSFVENSGLTALEGLLGSAANA